MLPPYDASARCPKCGNDAVTTEYEAEVSSLTKEERDEMRKMLYLPPRPHPAWLHRSCLRCLFGWYERPLDEEVTT